MKVKLHSTKNETESAAAASCVRVAPSAPEFHRSEAASGLENVTMTQAQIELQEKIYSKLYKLQEQARAIADRRDANETKWIEAYEKARRTPGWAAECAKTGSCESYNYGDVIC